MATATNVAGNSQVNMGFTENITTGLITPLSPGVTFPSVSGQIVYANGTIAGSVDYIYAKQLTLAGAVTTLDLTALTDLSGGAVNFARVRLLAIQNLATTAGFTVTIAPGTTNPWTTGPLGASSTVVLQPSVGQPAGQGRGRVLFEDADTVGATTGWYVDGTHKTLKLDPGANTLSVNILIVGGSAVS